MSSEKFRGKESSNRIELSQLVQDLLNFGVLGSLQLWGGGRWVGGVWGIWGVGGVTTHMHTHANACIEIANGRRLEASMFIMYIMFNMHVHACVHVCVRVCMGHPLHTHTHPHPHPPPPRGTPKSVKI